MHLFHRAAAFIVIGMLAQSLSSHAQDIVAPMAAGPGLTISRILSGNGPALSVKVKDFGPDWRVFTLLPPAQGGAQGQADPTGGMMGDRVYYTRGQSLMVGRDTYLVAYQARSSSGGGNPWVAMFTPGSVTRNSTLYLSLVNVSRSGGLSGIRQFDIKSIPERQELADASDTVQAGDSNIIEVTRDGKTITTSDIQPSGRVTGDDERLKALGVAVRKYAWAHRDRLPAMATPERAMRALRPYAGARSVFRQVVADLPYVPNATLSGKKLSHIASPGKVIVYYGRKPDTCGCHHALFADGSAHEILPGDWIAARKVSGITN